MPDCISVERKQELCRLLAENLPTLRTKANISQKELANRLGFSRQTISAVEGKKRDMQWSTFSAIIFFFLRDKGISKLMSVMGLLADDVRKTLDINGGEM